MANENTGHSEAKIGGEAFKRAISLSLHRNPKPLKAIADELGRSYSSVQKWADEREFDAFPPAHLLPQFCAVTKDTPFVAKFLAECAGLETFTKITGSEATTRQVSEACRDFARVLDAIAEAEGDGVITKAEAYAVKERSHALFATVVGLFESLLARAVDSPRLDGPREVKFGGQR